MRIWAWGANSNSQLGLGFKSEQESIPTQVKFEIPQSLQNKGLVLRDICGGAHHTLVLGIVLKEDSTEDNVENNQIPILGPLETINVSNSFEILCFSQVELEPLQLGFQQIAAGFDSNFYLGRNGQAKSFGDNCYCQLGRKIGEEESAKQGGGSNHKKNFTKFWGELDYASHPFVLDWPKFRSISIGLRHGAAISFAKDLYVWGDNSKYQGGIYTPVGPNGREVFPKLVQLPTKVDLPPTFKFSRVVCGKDFTIAVHESGYSLFGCGQNKHGVLLHAPQDVTEFRKFTHIFNHLSDEADIADLQAGWSHVLVLLTNGKVLSWGRNNFGQLGRTSVNPDFDVEPGYVESLPEKIVSIKCGSEHSLALSDSGKVYAWGWNEHDSCGVKVDKDQEDTEPMILEEHIHFDETDIRSRSTWRKDCILFPTLVQFPENVAISVIGCGAGSSFAVSS